MPYLGSATLCEVLVAAYDRPEFPAQAQLILDAVQDTALPPEVVIGRPRPHALLRNGSYINGIVHIGVQLANALDYVHRMGICHRDLKPSNVLMMPDGTPMLLDFNLSSDSLTAANRLGGTFPYMSPEQLLAIDPDAKAADGAHLDARSDLYSLGVILYELLTGKHPLGRVPSGRDLAKLRAYLLERQPLGIVPIRHVNPRVDRSLARAIERCLAYRPDDRGTAAELASDLRKCLSAFQRLRRYVRVHSWRATAAALIIATVVGAAGAFGAAAITAAHDPRVAQAQAQEAYRAGRFEEAISSLDKAIKADPKSAELYYARGRAYQRLGQVHSGRLGQDYMGLAIADYLRAEGLGLRDERILASKAFCFCQQSNLTDAIAALEEVIERGQPVGEVFNNLAYCYLRKKDLDKAEKALEKAFKLNPGLQAAFHNRAMLDFLKAIRPTERIPESGIEDIRRAFGFGPPNAELHRDAARLYAIAAENGKNHTRNRGWTLEALYHLKKAIELGMDPKDLAKDETFQSLKNEQVFQELATRPGQQERVLNTPRVVDPISD